MRIRLFLLIATIVFLGTISPGGVCGADYPSRPIEILCPYTPGASMDVLGRLVAEVAPKYTGQPMVVINKPGAGGSIAAADIVSSKPDGYKLIVLGNLFRAAVVKTQKVPFDPEDIVPIANFLEFRQGLMVSAEKPWKTVNDLIAYAKKNPGQLKWTHPGRGTGLHIIGVYIFKHAGVQTVDVPYKGLPEAIPVLLGGHLDAMSSPYGPARELLRAGKLRALAFYSEQRFPDQPDVPSIVELGFPDGCKVATYVGLYAHRNTPQSVKSYLVEVFKKVYDDPRFRQGIQNLGEDLKFGGPEWVTDSIRKAEEITVPILKENGLYVGK
jgi:tripartite-type tricarboxylate transporter receptor subunit TctC